MNNMLKNSLISLLIGFAALYCAGASQAAVTCTSMSATTLNFSYIGGTDSTVPRNIMSGNIFANCTRTAASDTVVTVGAGNGNNPGGGGIGRAILNVAGTNYFINYNLYRLDSTCNTSFGNVAGPPSSRISANFTGPLNVPEDLIFNFWGCISGQGGTNIETAGYPAGLYTDSAVITLRAGTGPILISNVININIAAPSRCTISGGPADINFIYTAFGAANFQSSAFTANCTNQMPYNMTLSPTAGVVGGLRYTLGLTAATPGSASNVGSTAYNGFGGATGKVYYINGLVTAGQAGQIGLPISKPHLLVITY
jgi:hypothetical protein